MHCSKPRFDALIISVSVLQHRHFPGYKGFGRLMKLLHGEKCFRDTCFCIPDITATSLTGVTLFKYFISDICYPSPVLLQGAQNYRQYCIAREEGMDKSHCKVSKSQELKKKSQAKLGTAGSGNQRKSLKKVGLWKPFRRCNGEPQIWCNES